MTLTPRQVELADVALDILSAHGMTGLTFRAVAAAAGCSAGAVQKSFPSKSAMLTAVFARLRDRAPSLPPGEPGRPTLHQWLVDLLLGILPLDQRRRAVQRQGDAFASLALEDPTIATAISASAADLRGRLAALTARARAEGEVPDSVDPHTVAWAMLALAQGLAAQLLYDPMPEDEVRTLLSTTVGSLLR